MSDQTFVIAVDDPSVLDRSILEIEPGANGANTFHAAIPDHLAKPSRIDHFGVVVQQQDILSGSVADGPGSSDPRN